MQKTVGGYLQAIYPFEDEIALVCDDESKLKSDTEWNRVLPETGDIIKGTFFITGLGAEDFTDLSPELMKKYKQSPVTASKTDSEYLSNLKSNATNANVAAAFLLS